MQVHRNIIIYAIKSGRILHDRRKKIFDSMSLLNQFENSTELYNVAKARWPTNKNQPSIRGRWILASYDDDSIIVYQAYNEQIAQYACENQRFTGCPGYSPTRMTCKNSIYV